MKSIKKALRTVALVLVLVLASVAGSLGAYVPVSNRRKEDRAQPLIELVENHKDNAETPGEEYQP